MVKEFSILIVGPDGPMKMKVFAENKIKANAKAKKILDKDYDINYIISEIKEIHNA